MVKKFFYKIWFYIVFAWRSLFYGMEAANALLTEQGGEENDNGIHQRIGGGGVYDDMLEQKVTKEVEELRDKHYRVIKEADTYDPSTLQMAFDSDGEPIFLNTNGLKKKTKEMFMKHSLVFNDDENLNIRTIQDNKQFEKKNSLLFNDENQSDLYIPNGLYDFDTTISIERDDIIPRFYLEKFAKRVCVRQKDNAKRALVDLYLPTQASQFGKIDAILVSNLYNIWQNNFKRSDITDFKSIKWVSDKAWGCDDLCLFEYDDVKYTTCNIFDGNFVLTFDCNIVSDGKYIPEKYITKELTEKYETEAPKEKAVDMFALNRKQKRDEEKKINLESKIIKINEDSD